MPASDEVEGAEMEGARSSDEKQLQSTLQGIKSVKQGGQLARRGRYTPQNSPGALRGLRRGCEGRTRLEGAPSISGASK